MSHPEFPLISAGKAPEALDAPRRSVSDKALPEEQSVPSTADNHLRR